MTRPCRQATAAALVGAAAAALLSSIPTASAFLAPSRNNDAHTLPSLPQTTAPLPLPHHGSSSASSSALFMATDALFELMLDLPGEGMAAQMKFKPVLSVPSEIIEVRYKLPFGLDVEPKAGLATCTKDGPGGEKVGDVLRYTSQWTLGLPRGDGVITTAMSFSGGISWQVSLFDVARAVRWEDVVAALVSNDPQRTNEVVLIFERPLPEEKE